MCFYSPLSMSENLAKLAQKIDFSKTATDDQRKDTVETTERGDEDSSTKDLQSSLWPWDSVRNKLRWVYKQVTYII